VDDNREQQTSMTEYMRVLYRGKWIIVICFLVVLLATIYHTFTTAPVYEASGMVMIKEDSGIRKQLFNIGNPMQEETRINNQVEILRSVSLGEMVIRELQKSPQADSLWILGKRKRQPRFRLPRFLSSHISKPADTTVSATDLADNFRKNCISVMPKRNTDMIEMKVLALSPSEAALVANTWMQVYKQRDIDESRGEVAEVKRFLEEKLKGVQDTLIQAEDNLKEYKQNNQVAELSAETEQMIKQSAEFETAYQEAKTELGANEKRLVYLKSQLSENQRVMLDEATATSSSIIQQLEKQMGELIGRKAAYEQQLIGAGYSTANDSKLRQMEARLKGLQDNIAEETKKLVTGGATGLNPRDFSESLFNSILEIETANKALKVKTEELGKIVAQFNQSLNALPEKSLKLARLMREAEVNDKIFMMMREKYEENRIAEAGQIGSVRIVDIARPPRVPVKPKKRTNILLGIILGFGLGVGITFFREYIDTTFKSSEDVERTGMAVLGLIPFISTQRVGRHHHKNGEFMRIESRLITHFAPKSPISEAYRTLRTNIQYANPDRKTKTILMTSSGMGEGKSTSVANLAITFAQMGAKTLLVDTDLRRPVLHGIFEQSRNEGLTTVLVGRLTLDQAVKASKIDNLAVLTSGTLPPNPSELLASKQMEKMIDEATHKYDIVLFDTPPVIPVTDAAVLAPKMDAVVLVVRHGVTNKDALSRSRMLLDNVKANLLGVLFNGMTVDRMSGSYYYYYYTSDGKEKKR
jgi:capsular exopolysaccharide synthesis family protein